MKSAMCGVALGNVQSNNLSRHQMMLPSLMSALSACPASMPSRPVGCHSHMTRKSWNTASNRRQQMANFVPHATSTINNAIPDSVITETDLDYLARAAALSLSSCGETQPHPNAACVLTDASGTIVSEAYLSAQGTEAPELLAVFAANGAVQGGTAYLNLETGDCHGDAAGVRALIASGVRRAVIGLRHPVTALRGTAIDALRSAGLIVAVLGESPCAASVEALEAADAAVLAANEPLLHVAALGRPLGILKYAMTLDGKIAASSGHSAWVSGPDSRQQVFHTRARSHAVIVGGQTVRRDDPRLTTRREGGHQPVRIVMSRTLDLPVGAELWDTSHAPTIVATQRGARQDFQRVLRGRGVEVLEFDFLTPGALADYCRQRGYLSLLWECGGTLAAPAIANGAVHKVMAFVAPKIIGGTKAPTPVGDLGFVEMTQALPLTQTEWTVTGQDLMLSGYLPNSGGARALAVALDLRTPLPDPASEQNGHRNGSGGRSGVESRLGTTRAPRRPRVAAGTETSTPIAGFYKTWDRYGCFSNFTPHAIAMPEGPMTHIGLETFYPRPGSPPGPSYRLWKSSEHYYQAQKFAGVQHPDALALVEQIAAAPSPEAAAALGRRTDRGRPELLREDWGRSKIAAMHAALRAKFAAHEGPRKLLVSTAQNGATIVETAPHDYFWGRGMDGTGYNMLGKLLMKVRDEIIREEEEGKTWGRRESGKVPA